MKKSILALSLLLAGLGIASPQDMQSMFFAEKKDAPKAAASSGTQRRLGGLSPEDALEYMKNTEGLVIVDVAPSSRYKQGHFEGAISIPVKELGDEKTEEEYKKIPAGRPVIIHCRLGVVAPGAYERFLEVRPDVPEVSFIAGKPPFTDYYIWRKSK